MPTPLLPNPAPLLSNTGLHGEINRLVLHKYGMALGYVVDESSNQRAAQLIVVDAHHAPEGLIYDEECLADIAQKLERFHNDEGNVRLTARYQRLGFTEQPLRSSPSTPSPEHPAR